jgi:hypothetical protein
MARVRVRVGGGCGRSLVGTTGAASGNVLEVRMFQSVGGRDALRWIIA